MMQIPASLLTLVAGVVITLVSIWVGQNYHFLLPVQASEQAPLVDGFFQIMLMIGVALFIVVEGAIVLFVIQFRRRSGDDTDGVPLEGNVPLEIFWTAIPAIIVVWLSTYSVEVYREMGGFDPTGHQHMAHAKPATIAQAAPNLAAVAYAAPMDTTGSMTMGDMAQAPSETVPDAAYGIGPTPRDFQTGDIVADLVVNVTGIQFAWIFNYPNDDITAGELHVPVGKDVQVNLKATDVIHSFWVPQFRIKQDVIPGQPAELRFTATRTGDFPIVCTELCGSYHGAMRSRIIVHEPEEFEAWLSENRLAQATNAEQTVAVNPQTMQDGEFLAPYATEMGVKAETLAQIAHGSIVN